MVCSETITAAICVDSYIEIGKLTHMHLKEMMVAQIQTRLEPVYAYTYMAPL